MKIIVKLDAVMKSRNMSSVELANKTGLTPADISALKTEKAKAIRLSTLASVCKALDCQPGELLEYGDD